MEHMLDIRGLLCPITWARVKRELLVLHAGDRLTVTLDHRPAVPDIRRNAAELGHDVVAAIETNGVWTVTIELGESELR